MTIATESANQLAGAIGRKLDAARKTFTDFALRVGDGHNLTDQEADELLEALSMIGKTQGDFYALAAARRTARESFDLAAESSALQKALAAAALAHATCYAEVECAAVKARAMLEVSRVANCSMIGWPSRLHPDTELAERNIRSAAVGKLEALRDAHSKAAYAVGKADNAKRAIDTVRLNFPEAVVGL